MQPRVNPPTMGKKYKNTVVRLIVTLFIVQMQALLLNEPQIHLVTRFAKFNEFESIFLKL